MRNHGKKHIQQFQYVDESKGIAASLPGTEAAKAAKGRPAPIANGGAIGPHFNGDELRRRRIEGWRKKKR